MKKQIKVSGTMVCLLVLALTLALYYGFVFTSLFQKTSRLSAQHTANLQQLSAYQEVLANRDSVQKSIDGLKADIRASSSSLGIPPSGLSGDIEKGLAGAGVTATGITMSNASPGKKTQSGRVLTQVAVTVTADCTEPQLAALLHYFERGTDAVYTVGGVNMNTGNSQGKTANGQYAVTLNMTAYYLAGASSGTGS